MNEVAYIERDLKAIFRRRLLHFFYTFFKRGLGILSRRKEKKISSITTYPKIEDQDQLIDIANKLAWAFPNKDGLSVDILVDEALLDIDLSLIQVVPNQRNYLTTDITHINLVTTIKPSDLVLFTKGKEVFKRLWQIHKSDIIDKWYYSTVEGDLLKSGFYKTVENREKEMIKNISIKNYTNMMFMNQHKTKSYCFVTGPSFDTYDKFKFEPNSFKVICNSIVKNDDFLEYIIKPDLLVFADPVFHFGTSEYSALFRDKVLNVHENYSPFIIVPFESVALLLAHYPHLKNRIIGMKSKKGTLNFPSPQNFWTRSSTNILTLYMLPVASSITEEIYIVGADGRKNDEKYFWKHSKSAQFDDMMETVFETHPSFFRDRNYEDYYHEHCEYISRLIEYGEDQGKNYFSLTKSYIPALRKRLNNTK